jgi:hypothetical protein
MSLKLMPARDIQRAGVIDRHGALYVFNYLLVAAVWIARLCDLDPTVVVWSIFKCNFRQLEYCIRLCAFDGNLHGKKEHLK